MIFISDCATGAAQSLGSRLVNENVMDESSLHRTRIGAYNVTVQTIGAIAIAAAMLIAFMQKATDAKQDSPTPKLTMVAVTILFAVGLVDFYLWALELGTFTSYIQGIIPPFFGFFLMIVIFIGYWKKRGTAEALDVMFGILMGHFWWSWCY